MELGDKVKIKPFFKIENTLDYDDYYDELFFDRDMKRYCGNTEILLDVTELKPEVKYGDWKTAGGGMRTGLSTL